jgi:UDP-3-O-acyl-N-acetylglucosamine deacetylase
LRLQNEPGRHKLLDLIGDLALLDARLQARVLGIKAGHRWHVEAARKVWEET